MSQQVIVVGAGIGGLTAALALAEQGVHTRVVERAPAIREVGAGVQIGPNAFRAFARLGVVEPMDGISFRPEALRLLDSVTGLELSRQTLGAGFEARFHYPYRVAFRADMQNVLLQAAAARPDQIEIALGDGLRAFEPDLEGVTIHLESGAKLRGVALVGADGIRSSVRAQLIDDGEPCASGYIAYRAVLPVDAVPDALLTKDVQVWVGPYHHLVCYRLRRGALFNIVAIFRSARLDADWEGEGAASELMAAFSGSARPVRRLLEQIQDWKVWVLYDRPPRTGWSQGRVTLLGDAAHPMLPFLAQGACMAIEDAIVLGDQVAGSPDLAAAFSNYERRRYPRTSAVQLAARRTGEINHAAGAAREARNQALAAQPADDYEAVAWLFEGADSPDVPPHEGYGAWLARPDA